VPADEQAVDRIMAAQLRMQRLFAHDRSNPLFSLPLTMPQLRILMLLEMNGGGTGRELAASTGVGLATMTGMIDRLAAQDLVTRREDPRDRRVRRIELTPAGRRTVTEIMSAGAERHRAVLSRLTAAELAVVERAVTLMVEAATAELGERGELPAGEGC
jgi:DNA-binding MarR family transcriptional regulator